MNILRDMPSACTIVEKEMEITNAIQRCASRENYNVELGIQPMSGLHLENDIVGNAAYTNPLKVYILIGLALLFIASVTAVFIIVLASVSLQSLKAAMANPVEAMRME